MFRRTLAVLAVFALAGGLSAADLPAGTWAVNVDGEKGALVITDVKDGKFAGSLLGTDVTGTWNGKTLTFQKGQDTYEAFLVSEPGDKGKVKYTLTGTKSTILQIPNRAGPGVHVVKAGGWYAQLTTDAPAPTGEIRAEVRGVLVIDASGTYVSVKRKNGNEIEEAVVRVFPSAPDDDPAKTFKELNGKDVIATGKLGQLHKASGELYFLDKPQIKLAPK
ncbi:MAG: hypothetical protein K2V38_27910 [Gemmataceae bacterium]|nr:hypothetical protein [Gemmataceae bacterium]